MTKNQIDEKQNEKKIEKDPDQQEYLEFIKSSVEDGSYFKDALNWYFFRYVTPICDRTLLIFGGIIASVVLFFLYQMIRSTFPLVEQVPVFIAAKDQSLYFPNITPLKPKKGSAGFDQGINTVDEAIAKYLISVYVKERESYDFSRAEAEDVNRKFNRIKNTSSSEEYRNFQILMSPDNPDSPIKNFGQQVVKSVTVESVSFVRKQITNFADQAKEFLTNTIPTEAEVRFSATTKTVTDQEIKEQKERYLAKIKFDFKGVSKDQKTPINFAVTSYKLYLIK